MKRLLGSKLLFNIGVLVIIFIVSVGVRYRNLQEPMGRHHEWLTGHVLSTVYILDQDGASKHYYSPVWTFNTQADRYIQSKKAFKDKDNFTYYVSYPPMCFLLPYGVFKIIGLDPSISGIRIIGLLVQFLIGFFIVLLLYGMFDKKFRMDFFAPAIVAFVLYTFSSGNMWFHGHVFFADMLVPLFIVSFLIIVLKTLRRQYSTRKSMVLLFITCTLGAYTEWQMLFVAFFTGVLFLVKGLRERSFLVMFFVVALAAILPLILTFYQYSSIAGFEELKKVLTVKYQERSGTTAISGGRNIHSISSYIEIIEHYWLNYASLIVVGGLSFFGFIVLWFKNHQARSWKEMKPSNTVLILLLLSVVLHHIVFFNFTCVHDFSGVKTGLFLAIFCAYVAGLWLAAGNARSEWKPIFFRIAVSLILSGFVCWSVRDYYKVNYISNQFRKHQLMGTIVSKYTKPNEVIFAERDVTPVTNWYTKRNLIATQDSRASRDSMLHTQPPLNIDYIRMDSVNFEVLKYSSNGDTLSYQVGLLSDLK